MKESELKILAKNGIYLNDLQKLGLNQAEVHGWHLMGNDMPSHNTGYIIVKHDDSSIGILKTDGTIDVQEVKLPINPFDDNDHKLH